jgi:hypothetical protein
MEQIHHILAAVIVVYETKKVGGVLPPAILSEIAKFVEWVTVGSYFRHNLNDHFQNPSQNTRAFQSQTGNGKTQALAESD